MMGEEVVAGGASFGLTRLEGRCCSPEVSAMVVAASCEVSSEDQHLFCSCLLAALRSLWMLFLSCNASLLPGPRHPPARAPRSGPFPAMPASSDDFVPPLWRRHDHSDRP